MTLLGNSSFCHQLSQNASSVTPMSGSVGFQSPRMRQVVNRLRRKKRVQRNFQKDRPPSGHRPIPQTRSLENPQVSASGWLLREKGATGIHESIQIVARSIRSIQTASQLDGIEMGRASDEIFLRRGNLGLLDDFQPLPLLTHHPKRPTTRLAHVGNHARHAKRSIHPKAQTRVFRGQGDPQLLGKPAQNTGIAGNQKRFGT